MRIVVMVKSVLFVCSLMTLECLKVQLHVCSCYRWKDFQNLIYFRCV